jgi:thiol-disulfide isomerase/thioredoxin
MEFKDWRFGMTKHIRLLISLTLAVFALGGSAWGELPLGGAPPPFIGPSDQWINSKPLTWAELRGKVVLVDFWEYTCVNCIRTDPYLRAWYQRYKSYGFVIVGIQTPEFGFSSIRNNVASAAKRDALDYPILNDPESRNWKAYHENFWPSKYLFDQNGRLVYQHTGEGDYQNLEREIQRLLLRNDPQARFPSPLPPVRPGDRSDAVCSPDTPELYTNPSYGFLGNLPSSWEMDKAALFIDNGRHVDGKVYAKGSWIPRYQSLQHARPTNDLRDFVVISYRGTEVNAVINRTNDKDYKVYVTLDGKPVPSKSKGDDVRYDERGSYVNVDAPRMYNVVRGEYGVHELKLASDSPEFDLYSYTFSGCSQR